jgi:hypothetical protein
VDRLAYGLTGPDPSSSFLLLSFDLLIFRSHLS